MQKVANGIALNGEMMQRKIWQVMKKKGRAERFSFFIFLDGRLFLLNLLFIAPLFGGI